MNRTLQVFLGVLALGVAISSAIAQERPRREVSWVNSKLPESPGLSHHVLPSKALGRDVGYVVWKPEDFDDSGATRYGVIYFLHGMGGNESADAGGFSSLVRSAVKRGVMPPVICVFPNGGRSGYRGEVETMIVDELIPLIDKSYPTKAEAGSRVVAGFSMGGAGSVRLSLLHPELFCAAASWGGGMWRDSETLLAAVDRDAKALKANAYATLLINGDQDRPDAYASLVEKLSAHAIPSQVVVLEDTPHNLGLYYQRSGKQMTDFLGEHLKPAQAAAP
ncbi:MAG: alpha/beta hydrolase-fold protein [Pirellulaceae bacterium]